MIYTQMVLCTIAHKGGFRAHTEGGGGGGAGA